MLAEQKKRGRGLYDQPMPSTTETNWETEQLPTREETPFYLELDADDLELLRRIMARAKLERRKLRATFD
jgi:hypothetical protein